MKRQFLLRKIMGSAWEKFCVKTLFSIQILMKMKKYGCRYGGKLFSISFCSFYKILYFPSKSKPWHVLGFFTIYKQPTKHFIHVWVFEVINDWLWKRIVWAELSVRFKCNYYQSKLSLIYIFQMNHRNKTYEMRKHLKCLIWHSMNTNL